ncbi:hypothetical protein [Neobacillus sp.]|uniref:hypothetical protein n=1 Tax=Neobacillus sp. TaxID=2675273 RepID=UPI00289B4207|nr:hypothetical protein [Neobacillus sp.]
MGKLYKINLDAENGILFVKASGIFKEEDAKVYISEFQTTVNTINPSIYKLILDVSEQEAVDTHVFDDIRFVLRLYSSAKFKKIVVINPTSVVSKMQIDHCAKEIKFTAVFVDSVVEAYSL